MAKSVHSTSRVTLVRSYAGHAASCDLGDPGLYPRVRYEMRAMVCGSPLSAASVSRDVVASAVLCVAPVGHRKIWTYVREYASIEALCMKV